MNLPNESKSKNPSKKKIFWGVSLFLFVLIAYGLASRTKPSTYFSINNENEKSDFFKGQYDLALVKLEGVIMGSDENIQKVQEALDQILDDSNKVKGLVMRINSPGGSVAPTQEIYNKLLEIRKKMPVYCSIGEVAASGGYYIASACTKIFANKGSTTGSIGVIMQLMNMKELFEWAKVKPQVMKAGKFKDIASPFKDMPPEEKELLQNLLDEIHQDFKNDVLQGRGDALSEETVQKYADGRIFTGNQALAWGFIDEIGGQRECVDKISQELGLKGKPKIKELPEKKSRWAQYFENKSREGLINQLLWGGQKQVSSLQPGVPYFLPEYHLY